MISLIAIVKTIALLGTIATGLLALFKPMSVQGFTGLNIPGARGKTEIRAVFGGLFIALGIVPFFLGAPAFQMLGFAYLGIAAVRLPSMFLDHSVEQSNWISLVVEIVFGILLLV